MDRSCLNHKEVGRRHKARQRTDGKRPDASHVAALVPVQEGHLLAGTQVAQLQGNH